MLKRHLCTAHFNGGFSFQMSARHDAKRMEDDWYFMFLFHTFQMSEQHDAKYMGDNLFFADKSPHKIETSEIMKKNLYNRVKH